MSQISETNYQNNAYSGIVLNAETAEWSAKVNATTVGGDVAEVTLNRSDLNSSPKFCYNCWYYVTVLVETSAETEYRVWFQRLSDNGTEMPELQPSVAETISISETGAKSYAKFILSSKDSFQIAVTSVSGQVRVNVSTDPNNIDQDPIWSLTQTGGSGVITVATDDPSFQFATYYFVSVEQLNSSAASCKLELI